MRLTRFSLPCPSGLSSGICGPLQPLRLRLPGAVFLLPTCDPSRALAAAPSASEAQPEPASARRAARAGKDSGRRGGRKEAAREGSGWKVAIGARKEGGSRREGGRRQRAQGAAGGSQLSARPAAAASACRGAAGRDGLARGRPLLLPRSAAPPALRAHPTGEWPRHTGRERRRASALCVTAHGRSQGRAPGGVESPGVREHRARRDPEAGTEARPLPSRSW